MTQREKLLAPPVLPAPPVSQSPSVFKQHVIREVWHFKLAIFVCVSCSLALT